MKFNDKLVMLRKQHGYSQESLAEKLGVSRQAISRWELGETTPEMIILVSLCDIFHVSADYLIHDEFANEKDIPAVKAKNNELQEMVRKSNGYILASAIAGCIGAYSSIFAIIYSNNGIQLVISCFMEVLCIGLAISQFVRYFKHKILSCFH